MPTRLSAKFALLVVLVLLCAGCGDQFRPVATPITPSPPDSQAFHLAITVNANTTGSPGSNMSIDVSGDSRFSSQIVGNNPVHAILLGGSTSSRVYSVNQGDNSVSSYSASSQGTPVTTTLLPAGAAPNFVASTETSNVYVSMPGISSVGVISVNSNAVKAQVPVGANPVALVETSDGKHVYSINQGDNTVTAINTADDTVSAASPIHVGASPVWGVQSSAGLVYVLNQGDGTISVIDPGSDTVVGTLTVAPGANYMTFDAHRNRLYVTNPVASTVTIFDLSQPTAAVLATVPVAAGATSVTALVDGSRAYAVSFQSDGATVSSTVTVIDANSNFVRQTIPLPSFPVVPACNNARFRVSTASSAEATKVYVAHCDAGSAMIIRTSDDTVVRTLPAPTGTQFPTPQNPVWIFASK